MPLMKEALGICRAADARIELLWASPRELLNIVQAAEVGCDIITVTPDLLKKLELVGKDLAEFSLETVQMFYKRRAGRRVQAVSADFVRGYLEETLAAVRGLDAAAIDGVATGLARVREAGGRLFILGVGGSAGHASHAVNDFRKICGFEAYAPTDNVSELTARVNDEGWETSFSEWLKVSRLGASDARAGLLRRRRQPREERVAQPGARAGAGAERRRAGVRHRRQGRRLHGGCRRGLRDHPDRLAGSHHAAHRGPVRRRLAPAGQPPRAEGGGDQVGIDEVAAGPL